MEPQPLPAFSNVTPDGGVPAAPAPNAPTGGGAVVHATIEIKRAATGKVETYNVQGYLTREQLEAGIREGTIKPNEEQK